MVEEEDAAAAKGHCPDINPAYRYNPDDIPVLETIRPDQLGVDLSVLCKIRERVMAVKMLDRSDKMNGQQASILRDGLERDVGLPGTMDLKYLKCAKYVLGRWPRPSEMKVMFPNDKIWRQRFVLTALDPTDPTPSMDGSNTRISHAIGRAGSSLNRITQVSHVCYIWFGPYRKNKSVVAAIYASGKRPEDASKHIVQAQRLINQHSKRFQDRNGTFKKGFKLEVCRESGFSMMEVPFRELANDMAR